jgi:hypothetical protein
VGVITNETLHKDHGMDNQVEQDLARGLQSLGISNPTSNPFHSRPTVQSTGYNPFLSQTNDAQGDSTQPSMPNPFRSQTSAIPASYERAPRRRANAPAVGNSEYSPFARDLQSGNVGMSGYMAPAQLNIGHGQDIRRWSHTPAIGYSQPQQYVATPRRPQTAQIRGTARSSEHSSRSGSNMRGMKVQQQKHWRGFYKAGRVWSFGMSLTVYLSKGR